MASFGKVSLDRLATCHLDLQRLFNEVIKDEDCTILCGHRGEQEQNDAFDRGYSRLRWPHGKHNSVPSMAVDVMPYPIDWSDIPRIVTFANFVKLKSQELGITIQYGGDWKYFWDYPHYELIT